MNERKPIDNGASHDALFVLRQSEELRRLAEEAGSVGSFEIDLQTGDANVSPELLAIYGVEPGSVSPVQAVWFERVHPDDLSKIAATVGDWRPDGPPWSCEFRILRPDGEVRWIEARARTTFDSQGQPVRRSASTWTLPSGNAPGGAARLRGSTGR